MGLTPKERALRHLAEIGRASKPGSGVNLDWWDAYVALWNKVDAQRKAAGLLPWPDPPIPKPRPTGNAVRLLLEKAESPDFLKLPLIDQDAWFADMCALDAVLALLRSPGFDALPGREQLAALFGRWPESQ
jgi:hypothetical protein